MAIRAYNESYLPYAQDSLGHAADFAIVTLGLEPDVFANAFIVSTVSRQFAIGNPRFVAGMNGCELAREMLSETHTPFTDTDDAMYLDKSPEYWAGWVLAYYQWNTGRSFTDILSAVSFSHIIRLYSTYHEMDIRQFADHMDKEMKKIYSSTRLKFRRVNCGMSQSELAADSGVALRQIQLFEQRRRNINNASAITLLQLSKSLHCRMEDLIEYEGVSQAERDSGQASAIASSTEGK